MPELWTHPRRLTATFCGLGCGQSDGRLSPSSVGTGLHLFPSIVYNISPDRGETWFVRGGAGLSFSDVDTGFADVGSTRFAIGGGVGARLPVTEAFAIRLEGAVEHWFEDDDDRDAFNLLLFLVGFSFFVD